MAVATYSTLKIAGYDMGTGSLTTITFLDPANAFTGYQMPYAASWAPNVAKRKDNVIAGGVSYTDVEEEITLNIVSQISAADCSARLTALLNLLDQADRWYDGMYNPPIRVYYQPKGSTKAQLYNALILGNRTVSDPTQLPMAYDTDLGTTWRINGVVIKFLRAGLWLLSDATDTQNNTASSPQQGGSVSYGLATRSPSRVPSPIDATLGPFITANIPVAIPASLLLVGNIDDPSVNARLTTQNASPLASGAFTSFGEAAAKRSVSGNLLRYTPAVTTYVDTARGSFNDPYGYNFAIYASVRNNSTTTTFKVKLNIGSVNATTSGNKSSTQEVLIDASIQTPRIVLLGTVSRMTLGNMAWWLSVQASAASGTLDFDQVWLVAIDDELTSIIELGAFNITNEVGAGTFNIGLQSNQGDTGVAAPYGAKTPTKATITLGVTSTYANIPYVADLPLMLRDYALQFMWLAVGSAGADRWQFVDNANNVLAITLTTTRHIAYLIPE